MRIQYQMFGRDDRVVTKEKEFKTQEQMQKWVAKQTTDNGNFIAVVAYEVSPFRPLPKVTL